MEIKTSHGDLLEIENNEYLKFKFNNEEYKVLIKKISIIGDLLFISSSEIKKTQGWINLTGGLALFFLFFCIKYIIYPWHYVHANGDEEVSRVPDFFCWFFFLIFFGVFLFNYNIIQKIKSIDKKKTDYELTISVPSDSTVEIKKFVICKGSFEELKEIKSQIEKIKLFV